MATSESRSPFRLPWSSDRSHEDLDRADPDTAATDAVVDEASPAVTSGSDTAAAAEPVFPSADLQAFDLVGAVNEPIATGDEPVWTAEEPIAEEAALAVEVDVPAPVAPRKPTKLMADLATAIRATTEAARDHALAAVEVEATDVTGAIRAASSEGAEALRRRSDEDLVGIKEWSKAEIAQIREESEERSSARKAMLATELAAYASAVEHHIGEVEGAVARYRVDMDAYFESLTREDDPSRLATMAEAMPEPLTLDAWRDISDLDLAAFVPAPVEAFEPEPVVALVETFEPEVVVEAVVENFEPESVVAEAVAETFEPEPVAEAVAETFEPEPVVEAVAETFEPEPVAEAETVVETVVEADTTEDAVATREADTAVRPNPWATPDDAWSTGATRWATATATATAVTDEAVAETSSDWGEPFDRSAIMATMEAEAAVTDEGDETGLATDDAADFDSQSFADRLASLLPSPVDVTEAGEPRTTQVVVTGLVSVASIASFKRHLGRLPGVQSVGVASGPGGEFVFHVSHRTDVSFRDAIPSMPGFGARVTGTADGVVSVTARDPEAEG